MQDFQRGDIVMVKLDRSLQAGGNGFAHKHTLVGRVTFTNLTQVFVRFKAATAAVPYTPDDLQLCKRGDQSFFQFTHARKA